MARFWERFMLAQRGPLQRYGVAALLAVAALVLAFLLQGIEGGQFSSLALASVVLSAIYGGLGPALLGTAITAVGIDYLLSEPRYVVFDSWTSVIHIVMHGLVGALIANIVASLRNAYHDAQAARRAREDILAVVSHDLRSPLSSILLRTSMLKRQGENGLSAAEALGAAEGIARSGHQMRRLIEDLLDAVRIEKGQFRIEIARHDLLEIVEDAVHTVLAAAEAKGIRLEQGLPERACYLRCDRERITQALANLLGNAVKFSPDGAVIEVAVQSSSDSVEISVKDSGPGIAEAELPRLFGRYWQAQSTAQRGTGLGLFITKSIVEAHGGRIRVASQPGDGALFTISLPREPGPT